MDQRAKEPRCVKEEGEIPQKRPPNDLKASKPMRQLQNLKKRDESISKLVRFGLDICLMNAASHVDKYFNFFRNDVFQPFTILYNLLTLELRAWEV